MRLSTEESEEAGTPIEPTPATEELKKERSAISEYLATIGRKGGLKGGMARKDKLTAERRREIAQAAAAARWHKEWTIHILHLAAFPYHPYNIW